MLFNSLILFWIISNVILSYFLDLAPDEAYYWVWSNYLSFGYFDHPPLIALSIKIGYLIFKNELGVRILTIILTTISIIILYRMIKQKDEILFVLLISSNLLLNAGGFIAVPDGLLVFSESLFFYSLRNYLMKDDFKNVFFVSISIALMLYSKYHSILIILFTIIATKKIIFKKSFYLISALSLIFYLPHIIWQFQNDFITIKYQLFRREGLGFEINNVFDYALGQFLVYGPLVGFITIISSFLYKPKNVFENVLKLNLIGTLLFFLIMSFRNRIEANWTCSIIFPLIYLSYHYLIEKKNLRKFFISISVINSILILVLKAHILFPIFNFQNDPTSQFRNWKSFSKEIKKIVKDNNLCATNYQLASELYFYLGRPVGFYKLYSRDNQFNLLKLNINCSYIVSHVRTENVIDSLNAPYLGKVYLKMANLSRR